MKIANSGELSNDVKSVGMPLGVGGRIAIPKEFRKALRMVQGERVVLVLDVGARELRVLTVREGVRRAQATALQHNPEGRSMVDELIAERRAEAAREDFESQLFADQLRRSP